MDWRFDPDIDDILQPPPPATLRKDSLHLQQEGVLLELDEYPRALQLQSSDGPFIFDYNDLVTNDGYDYDENINNDGTCPTDTNSSESNGQHSSFGSGSAILSHQVLNDSETDWFLLQNPKSQRHNVKICDSSSTGGVNASTTSSIKDDENGRRSYCLGNSNSRNAVAARDNRLKKKKYIENLEESVRSLRTQNDYLLEQSTKTKSTVCGLRSEVSYLRSVIANQSVLSAILTNVMKTPGIKLSTSLYNTIGSNDCKKERVARDNSGHISDNSEEGPSTIFAQSGAVNSSSHSNQIAASSICSKKKSKQNGTGKKIDSHEKIRMRYDRMMEKNITVDIEHSGDSSASSDSFSTYDNVTGGICLHVAGQNVSIELCSHCNKNAHKGIISDHSYVKQ